MNLSNQNQRMVDAAREILEGKNEESINEVTRAYANAKITKADIKMVLAAAKKAGAKIKGNIAEFPNGTKIQIEIWHDVRIGFQSLNDPYARGGFEVFFGAKEAIKEFKKKKYTKIYESLEEYSLDEESSQISEKIARDGLNNFMKQKSVFDKLYEKVMVNENFDEMESEDFDALGLDGATPDDELEGEGDEITVTLSKDVAQALCDVLQAAMGESDDEDGDEFGADSEGPGEGQFGEEDEEGIDTGSTMSTSYDDGKNNKVGDLSPRGAASHKGANIKLDNGSNLKTAYNDGKSNKVGNLTKGKRAVD